MCSFEHLPIMNSCITCFDVLERQQDQCSNCFSLVFSLFSVGFMALHETQGRALLSLLQEIA